MATTEVASDGVALPIYSLGITLTYSSGNVTALTTEYEGNTYVQTFTYSGANVTEISNWVRQ